MVYTDKKRTTEIAEDLGRADGRNQNSHEKHEKHKNAAVKKIVLVFLVFFVANPFSCLKNKLSQVCPTEVRKDYAITHFAQCPLR